MQEDAGKLKSTVGERNKTESAASPPLLLESETTILGTGETKEVVIIPEEAQDCNRTGGMVLIPRAAKSMDKAARIERLRSGFRICKPQGSFLWPNMVMSPQFVVHADDHLVVPTPPSVSSSSSMPPQPQLLPPPASPVKPLAEMRTVAMALSSPVTKHPPPPPPPLETSTITAAASSLINLNEVPGNQIEDGVPGPGCQSHCHASVSPLTYQRRLHNMTAITTTPCAKKELNLGITSNSQQDQQTWLALAAPNSSLDSNHRRG